MSSLTTTSSMEESPEEFDTRLSLGIGGGSRTPRRRPPPVQFDELFPPQQALLLEDHHGSRHRDQATGRKNKGESRGTTTARQHNKRARTTHGGDGGGDRGSLSDGGDSSGPRKKLLLTREQAALLEDSFRVHNILSHAQKHDLARQLGLRPRQVEVWFQNRRARTKLRQMEVDCELLRRWCQLLSDENVRLRHELAEVRSSAVSRLTAAAVLCPSCDKLALVAGGDMARPN